MVDCRYSRVVHDKDHLDILIPALTTVGRQQISAEPAPYGNDSARCPFLGDRSIRAAGEEQKAKMHNKRSLFLKNSPFLILTGFLREGNIYQRKALAIRRMMRR